MLLLISGADFSGEALSIDHTVHVPEISFNKENLLPNTEVGLPAEIVEIFLVEGEDDICEVVNVGPAGLPPNTLHHLHEQSLPVGVDQRHQGLHFS